MNKSVSVDEMRAYLKRAAYPGKGHNGEKYVDSLDDTRVIEVYNLFTK